MIYYDEQKKGWAFDKLTETEHGKLMDLVEKHFISDLTYSMMKALQRQGAIPSSTREEAAQEDPLDAMWMPPTNTAQ